jgi:hypothetical protein
MNVYVLALIYDNVTEDVEVFLTYADAQAEARLMEKTDQVAKNSWYIYCKKLR